MAGVTNTQDVTRAVVEIGTHEAARILGTTIGSVVRYTQSGYLPTTRRSKGTGFGPHLYDRAVVEELARKRATATRILNWHSADWIEVEP